MVYHATIQWPFPSVARYGSVSCLVSVAASVLTATGVDHEAPLSAERAQTMSSSVPKVRPRCLLFSTRRASCLLCLWQAGRNGLSGSPSRGRCSRAAAPSTLRRRLPSVHIRSSRRSLPRTATWRPSGPSHPSQSGARHRSRSRTPPSCRAAWPLTTSRRRSCPRPPDTKRRTESKRGGRNSWRTPTARHLGVSWRYLSSSRRPYTACHAACKRPSRVAWQPLTLPPVKMLVNKARLTHLLVLALVNLPTYFGRS